MKKKIKKSLAGLSILILLSIVNVRTNFPGWLSADLKPVSVSAANTEQPFLQYSTHVQSYGWQKPVNSGTSGTTGKAKRLEGIKMAITDTTLSGLIEYRTHVEKYGWMNWKSNNDLSGTTGESKRLEAIEIRLTDDLASQYDIYYRVHAEKFGWLDWTKNGEAAGTAGYAYRLEAIEMKLIKKGETAPSTNGNSFKEYVKVPSVSYQTHVQSIGWQKSKKDGQMSGTSGLAKRLEGIKIGLSNTPYTGGIKYRTHVQSYGWMNWANNLSMSGTSGQAKRLEAIEIQLTGEMAQHFDVYYRVHAQSFGWLGWAKNGAPAGSAGYSKRLEGIEIKLVTKGGPAPGSTSNQYKDIKGKIEKKTIKVKEKEVDFKVTEEKDADLLKDEKVVSKKGVKGFDTVSYQVTYLNGKETERKEVSRKTTKPINQIIKVGTKVASVKNEIKQENQLEFKVVEEDDDTLLIGKTKTTQEGKKGFDTVIYNVTYTNGKETSRKEVSRKTTNPINQIIKVGTMTITTKEENRNENEVAFEIIEEKDNTLEVGKTTIVQKGKNGFDTVVYDVTYTNGKETSKKEITRVTTEPLNQIVKVGSMVITLEQEIMQENVVDFQVIEEEDNTLETGKTVVTQEGQNGFDKVTIEVTYKNGKETNRKEISREKINPINKILRKGTKILVDSIEIKNVTDTIHIGDSVQIESKIQPDNATDKLVVWSSSNENIATVNNQGLVSTLNIGTVTITVSTKDGTVSNSIVLNILPIEVKSIALDKEAITLTEGENFTFISTVLPENATNKSLTWTSSDENIVKVDPFGLVTALNAGEATLSVSSYDGKIVTHVKVTVIEPTVSSVEEMVVYLIQYDTYTLPTMTHALMSNDTYKEVFVDWSTTEIDTNTLGEKVYTGLIDGYDKGLILKIIVSEYDPNIYTNAYSGITINNLSKSISISLQNNGQKEIQINKIELYERGKLYSTYTPERLEQSGIASTVLSGQNWGITISSKLGVWIDNSYVKFYIEANGKEYTYENHLDR
ncbi:G5 domain-containing protein [Jeotgalibaca sp. MA1X17-3]|uniref:G5 domain-containing protein n=1 Tax=Jeotgalibaca sp. MA1X17-3 TaxID=2908211 RepID=UPI001F1A1D90|nr:G5 domain-containing protein [Jeotgalibaca sp. MA1X17-3]UJF15281.1 G5 domain-containing protein [Jeotgalibaca sp. MA1X17-3]